jgi:hypothetical protein
MRSTLLLVACIALVILAIKKYLSMQENKNVTQAKPAHHAVIKDVYGVLPAEIKLLEFYNY